MIGFLKKLLLTKPEPEEDGKRITLEELEKWLPVFLSEKIKEELNDIKAICQEISEKTKGLENVEVKEKKVEERLKNIVKGNTTAYIANTRAFVKKVIPPDDVDAKAIANFCSMFDEEIKKFNNRTIRSYYIMKNLIGEELDEITKRVKLLDVNAKKIKEKADGEKLSLHNEILSSIKKVRQAITEEKEGTSLIVTLKKEKEEAEALYGLLSKELTELEKNERLAALNQLKVTIESLNNLIKAKGDELVNLFSPLQKAMKKTGKAENSELIKSYLKDPCKALLEDNNYSIIKALDDLSQKIAQNRIELKEDKKEKTLEAMNRIKKDYLKEWKEAYKKTNKELEKALTLTKDNTVEEEIRNLQSKIEAAKNQIKGIEEKSKGLSKLNAEEEIRKIENKVCSLTNIKVKVV